MAKIEWLGHASFRIGNGVTIYIDPWKLAETDPPKADLILVSHSHFDHLSAEDIARISTPETVIIGSADCEGKVEGNFRPAWPGQNHPYGDVVVRTTRAYNKDKEFHPNDSQWLGFLVTVGGETIYYAGDTDVIDEMSQLGEVDVALLPVGGTYTMTAEEAAQAVNEKIRPKRAIPYHFGDIVGARGDAEKFQGLCQCPVEIQEGGKTKT